MCVQFRMINPYAVRVWKKPFFVDGVCFKSAVFNFFVFIFNLLEHTNILGLNLNGIILSRPHSLLLISI